MEKQIQDIQIGILGGGQLGRMLVQKAIDWDLKIQVLDPDSEAPCKNICTKFHLGSFKDYQTVLNFGRNCDVITIEIENVNVDALDALKAEGKTIYPSPDLIRTVQDKGLQKLFYRENHLPTSEFVFIESKEDIAEHQHLFPVMHKLRTGGYDGKGVCVIRSNNDVKNVPEGSAILEKLIDFKSELSVIVSRGSNGETKCFPAVDMEFNKEANLVQFLFSPSTLSSQLEDEAKKIALDIAIKLDLIGIMAVELFVTQDDQLLINEIAPRPHNSGHQTIEGNKTSQYEQMLRAITGLPLGDTDITQPSVMLNLLGEKGYEGNPIYSGIENVMSKSGVHIHLYGKKITKPYRKMGHVTIVDSTLKSAIETAQFVKKYLKVIA